MARGPYHRTIATSPDLYSPEPAARAEAARHLGRLARRRLMKRAAGWPENSPGAINAWLLLVTTKPPTWRDTLLQWQERPPTLGDPHEGFHYPDPLGFWTEVRRWATVLVRERERELGTADALTVTTLLHVGDDSGRLTWGMQLMLPRVVLFLDGPAWDAAGMIVREEPHYVPDPHRPQQVYEGFWGVTDDGTVVGKAPQHPATHKLYRAEDMDRFLRAAPLARTKP
ncbi:MAG: hypothetical protein QOG87_4245 [Actinomycetota bacterium]|jgi:hypothetical protein